MGKFVYVCSPLRGDIETNIRKVRDYCRKIAMNECDVIPVAPHIYCTQFLNDAVMEERNKGINMALQLLQICSELRVYGNEISTGMDVEINYAKEHKVPIHYEDDYCE